MIFNLDRQAFFSLCIGNALGNRPRFQDPINLQSKVIMEPRGRVLLNDKTVFPLLGPRRTRFRRFFKIPFTGIFSQSHKKLLHFEEHLATDMALFNLFMGLPHILERKNLVKMNPHVSRRNQPGDLR